MGQLTEKVLVFYNESFLECFSFSKERSIRKVKTGVIEKIVCFTNSCYSIKKDKNYEILEWKLNTGELLVLKTYENTINDIGISFKGTFLCIASNKFIEILNLAKKRERTERFEIKNITAMT